MSVLLIIGWVLLAIVVLVIVIKSITKFRNRGMSSSSGSYSGGNSIIERAKSSVRGCCNKIKGMVGI